MSEAISLRGQFEGWPSRLRDQKVFELAEVAERWAIARISAMVWKKDFDANIKGASPWRELENPYFLLFTQIIFLTANFIVDVQKKVPNLATAQVKFIFDDQGVLGARAVEWWDVLKQVLDPENSQLLLNRPKFASDKRVPALQAADLLAWCVRDVAEGGESSFLTSAVIQVLKKVAPCGGFVSGEQMRQSLPELIALSAPYWPR